MNSCGIGKETNGFFLLSKAVKGMKTEVGETIRIAEVRRYIIGRAAGTIAGAAVSATRARSEAGITAAVIGVILVNVCYKQLNGSTYGGS